MQHSQLQEVLCNFGHSSSLSPNTILILDQPHPPHDLPHPPHDQVRQQSSSFPPSFPTTIKGKLYVRWTEQANHQREKISKVSEIFKEWSAKHFKKESEKL